MMHNLFAYFILVGTFTTVAPPAIILLAQGRDQIGLVFPCFCCLDTSMPEFNLWQLLGLLAVAVACFWVVILDQKRILRLEAEKLAEDEKLKEEWKERYGWHVGKKVMIRIREGQAIMGVVVDQKTNQLTINYLGDLGQLVQEIKEIGEVTLL